MLAELVQCCHCWVKEVGDLKHRQWYVRAQACSNAFWVRREKEYFVIQPKWKATSDAGRQISNGDLVWIVEPTSPVVTIQQP